MKKATLEVRDLVGIMDFAAVEKRLAALPGVASVAMNAGSTWALAGQTGKGFPVADCFVPGEPLPSCRIFVAGWAAAYLRPEKDPSCTCAHPFR